MGLRHLPIVDECNCIVGMITRSDLLKPIQLSPEAPSVMLVAPVATAVQPPASHPICRIIRAKRLMTRGVTGTAGCRCLHPLRSRTTCAY